MTQDINHALNRYANGDFTRGELKGYLEGIGFSSEVTNILMRKADHKKAQVQNEEANPNDNIFVQGAASGGVTGRH